MKMVKSNLKDELIRIKAMRKVIMEKAKHYRISNPTEYKDLQDRLKGLTV